MALQARPLVLRVNEMDGLEPARGDLSGTGGTFLNIAHRGDSSRAPENTLAAFEAGVEAGASAVGLAASVIPRIDARRPRAQPGAIPVQ